MLSFSAIDFLGRQEAIAVDVESAELELQVDSFDTRSIQVLGSLIQAQMSIGVSVECGHKVCHLCGVALRESQYLREVVALAVGGQVPAPEGGVALSAAAIAIAPENIAFTFSAIRRRFGTVVTTADGLRVLRTFDRNVTAIGVRQVEARQQY